MRLQTLLLAAAVASTAGAAHAASVELRDAVARVTIVPEERSDVRVDIVSPSARLPITVRTEGARTIVDGALRNRIRDCHGRDSKARVRVRDVGHVSWEEMPQIVIRMPRDVALSSNGAVSGEIGRSDRLTLSNSGCANWTIADVAGDADIRQSGAGSVRMGASDRLVVRLSGAGSVHATQVRGRMEADLSGAGGVKVDRLTGSMTADVSGVGKVAVESGRASSLWANVSGLGGVEFGGSAETLDASISGIGSVRVKSVSGQVRKRVSGMGKVTIEEPS